MAATTLCTSCGAGIITELNHTYFGGYFRGEIYCDECCEKETGEKPQQRIITTGKPL